MFDCHDKHICVVKMTLRVEKIAPQAISSAKYMQNKTPKSYKKSNLDVRLQHFIQGC